MTEPSTEREFTARSSQRNVRAIILPVAKKVVEAQKAADPGKSKELPEDPLQRLMDAGDIIEPPFDILTLSMLNEHNTELNQCLEAMETNIDGFGHRLISRVKTNATARKQAEKDLVESVAKEKTRLENFFAYAAGTDSFVAFRRKLRKDIEATGIAGFEVIRNAAGDIQAFNHIPSYQIRLSRIESDAVKVKMPMLWLNEDGSISVKKVYVWKRFRKFVQTRYIQRRNLSFTGSMGVRWFKEFGDPRVYDYETGECLTDVDKKWQNGKKAIPEEKQANEFFYLSLYSPRTPYGLPRYIGNLLSIFGDRASEEINYTTFQNNNIPSMLLLVSNGQLTQASIDRIRDFVEAQIQGSDNYSKFLLLEAEGDLEGEDQGQVKIEVKPLTDEQHKDALFQQYSKNNQDKVRRAFRLPPIFVGRCHSEDTEYLTLEGWKLYQEVKDSDLLATVNCESGLLEYQLPTARHDYDLRGELVHLCNRGVDALVTLNHQMWTRSTVASLRREKEWSFVEASRLPELRGKMNGCIEIPVSAWWEGEEKNEFEIPGGWRVNGWTPDKSTKNRARDEERHKRALQNYQLARVPMDSFLRFLGYFISEGSTTETRGPIVLSQKRGPVAWDMVECLREIGFEPTVVESRPDELNISVCHGGLWEWLRENCGISSGKKRIPRFALGLPPRQLLILLDSMVAGDGSRDSRGSEGSFSYTSTSRFLNDQLHELCLKCGVALTSRRVNPEEPGWSSKWCSYGTVKQRHLLKVDSPQYQKVEYEGKVYCFTTPNGTLVTRRNGRVLVSGNSDDYTRATAESSRRLADEQIFAPERDEFDSIINRRIFPDMGIIYHRFKSNSPNTTDNTELVKILAGAEKTGGMTPRIARLMLEDILGIELPDFPKDFDPDQPFSLVMAEAVKNQADATEPGQQVTALKTMELIEKLTGASWLLSEEAKDEEIAMRMLRLRDRLESSWRLQAGLSTEE
jgi:PBSX family phage portal protein